MACGRYEEGRIRMRVGWVEDWRLEDGRGSSGCLDRSRAWKEESEAASRSFSVRGDMMLGKELLGLHD